MSKGNLTSRRVSVIVSDAHHTLSLIELIVRARTTVDGGELKVRVDKEAVERSARARIEEMGRDPDRYDMVGILAAQLDGVERGRIVWADEIETVEAVTV